VGRMSYIIATSQVVRSSAHPERRYTTNYFNCLDGEITVGVTWQSGVQEGIPLIQFLKDYNTDSHKNQS